MLVALLFIAIFAVDAFVPQATRYAEVLLRLIFMFVLGSFFFLARAWVRLSWVLLAALIAATWLSHGTAIYFALLYLTLGYGVLVIAFGPQWPGVAMTERTDLSYGIYLYGWPIQQVLVQVFPSVSLWVLLMPALFLSALAAWGSWHWIEAPALRLKVVFAKRRLSFAAGQGT
jgi:peptidoglycan/LPS O-acetylase OafA/YrhL